MPQPLATQLRPVEDADSEFLYHLYASTRAEEMALVPWTDEQKENFLRMQFHAQSVHYAKAYPDGRFEIIIADGEPAGRLITYRGPNVLHIVDIALLPACRGKGIGTHYLTSLLREAARLGVKATIYVEFNNPAQTLYERLGFRKTEQQGVYWLMELPAPAPQEQ